MPELPEVETIRLGLQKYLIGHTIEEMEVRLPKMVSGDVERVRGAKVQEVRRFGKGLVIDLSNDYSIAIHIKMTGQLVYTGAKAKGAKVAEEKVGKKLPHAHTHVIFKLKSQISKGKTTAQKSKVEQDAFLYYNDLRRFGWMKILPTKDVFELPFFKGLGPEVFKELNLELFLQIIKQNKGPVKPLLMDQKKISGIGNIYANDALYDAMILPMRKANSLTDDEIKSLFHAIEKVMRKGIEVGGSSEWSYVNALGETGSYQKIFLVYGREGEHCSRCQTVIQKVQFGGRGTYYCPVCQK